MPPEPNPAPPVSPPPVNPPTPPLAPPPGGAPVSVNQLTPEEQMALFEKDLKENDWGHQPC